MLIPRRFIALLCLTSFLTDASLSAQDSLGRSVRPSILFARQALSPSENLFRNTSYHRAPAIQEVREIAAGTHSPFLDNKLTHSRRSFRDVTAILSQAPYCYKIKWQRLKRWWNNQQASIEESRATLLAFTAPLPAVLGDPVRYFLSDHPERRTDARVLPTKFIRRTDLPYETGLQPATRGPFFPLRQFNQFPRVTLKFPDHDIFLYSAVRPGTHGFARLAYLPDGSPVAMISVALSEKNFNAKRFLVDRYMGVQAERPIGTVGRELYGVAYDASVDLWGIVTDIAPGEFLNKSSRITMRTLSEMRLINRRKFERGTDWFDMQLLIADDGGVQSVDHEFSARVPLKPRRYNDFFLIDLTRTLLMSSDHVLEAALKQISQEEPALLNSLEAHLKNALQNLSYDPNDYHRIHRAVQRLQRARLVDHAA